MPRQLQHGYAAPGRYRLKLTIGYGRHRHASAGLWLEVGAQPPPQIWFKIDGNVVATSDDAILSISNGPTFTLLGTRSGNPMTLDPRIGLPPETEITVGLDGYWEYGTLTSPTPEHPQGAAIITMETQTQPHGIDPPTFGFNYAVFDVATGQHVLTSSTAPRETGPVPLTLFPDGSIGVGDSSYQVMTPAGQVTELPLPGEGPFIVTSVVGGRVLVLSEGAPEEGCPAISVYDVNAKAPVSSSGRCLRRKPGLSLTGSFFDGSAYGIAEDPFIYSAATGTSLTEEGEFGSPEAFEQGEMTIRYMAGVRSDLVLAYRDEYGEGPSYLLSTSTWRPVFTAPETSSFTPYGIADDDIWVEAAAGQVVIDGHSGAQLASNWSVAPVAGGQGWTLVTNNPSGCCVADEYLLRSSGTLLENLPTAPS